MPLAELGPGEAIWYRRSGTGRPLLHIHGSAFGHRNFEKLTPLMGPGLEVIDFDLPGYGESRGPAQAGISGIAEQVHRFARSIGYSRLSVHGTSFGAMIALTLAAHHPELIERLVLSCFLARYDKAARLMRATWKRAALDSGMEAVADLTSVAGFARSFYERPEAEQQLASMRTAFARTRPEAFVKGTEMIEQADLTDLVPRVAAQTLLLAGAEDHMTPFAPAASGSGFMQFRPAFANAALEVLPDCGHYLVIEQAELASGKIREFLLS